ncbi:hypothetical protein, partial [Klebsiella pneumoniae]|uniref:hypothetical protein n=1 Tax=Klebsiella pneumoniae TaxID=573 RepID=UPI002551444E
MMKMTNLLNCGFAVLSLGATGLAHAHGSEPHKAPSSYSESDFEQMPRGIGSITANAQRTVNVSLSDNMRF